MKKKNHKCYLSLLILPTVHQQESSPIVLRSKVKFMLKMTTKLQHNERVSRKLRPRKLRPQTRKTQTLGCLENSDPEKTQTLGCLENSDPKNSDPWMSRKLRPEKLRPSGCLENSDPKNKTYLHRVNAASRLAYYSSIRWHYHNLPRKEKQFIVSLKLSAASRYSSGGYFKPDTTFRGRSLYFPHITVYKHCV